MHIPHTSESDFVHTKCEVTDILWLVLLKSVYHNDYAQLLFKISLQFYINSV